jgi:hypothetical protein
MATTTKSAPSITPASTADVTQVLELVRERGLQVVDFKFTDLPGTWQHFSIPAGALDNECFTEGLGFDGSSIRGFQAINESDMLLVPDPRTAFVDPVLTVPTLSVVCNVFDPITREAYSRDPRFVATKAEQHLKASGIATTSYWGPEAEFFIFNSVRFDQNAHEGYYHIDAEEGIWNSGRNSTPNLGHRPRHKEGYFPVPPVDRLQDLRSKIMLAMTQAGIPVEVHHHEVGTAGLRNTRADRRPDDDVQVHREERLPSERVHGDVHAEATVWRQRVGNARAPVAVEGRHERVLRRGGVRADLRDGAVVHRRIARARAGAARVLRADNEQLSETGTGFRGADQSHLLTAQPLGHLPHSGLLDESEVEAARVPRA